MPIPFLLAGLAVTAGVVGAGGHLSAKETNEKAEKISQDAQNLYNDAKHSLELAQNKTEKALLKLGYEKKNVLDSSMRQFLKSYDKIKHIQVTKTMGINELSKFAIDQQGAIELRKMTDIYSTSIKSGATGAAAGAVVALAASGSLSVVTGGLTAAGTALMAGEVSAAAGIAGSALSFGAAMTPLAAVAAPVILFTGISASMKADENLEKANTMYAEAEAASEKMKISETLCDAITDKSEIFYDLLADLNKMFSECAGLLEQVIKRKERIFRKKELTSAELTENDLRLIAVTRSLAGAVKAIIDTPILTKEGDISYESQNVYDQTIDKLPDFEHVVEEVKNLNYHEEPIVNIQSQTERITKVSEQKKVYQPNAIVKFIMWILAIFSIGCGLLVLTVGAIAMAITWIIAGLLMCPRTNKKMKFFPRLGFMLLFMVIGCLFV